MASGTTFPAAPVLREAADLVDLRFLGTKISLSCAVLPSAVFVLRRFVSELLRSYAVVRDVLGLHEPGENFLQGRRSLYRFAAARLATPQ